MVPSFPGLVAAHGPFFKLGCVLAMRRLKYKAPAPSGSEKTLLETGVGSDNGRDQGMQGTEEKGILPGV